MATSTGEGIGLQSGNRSDYWMRRLADDQRIDDANKRADEKALINELDLNIDPNKYYPKYAKAIRGEMANFYNSYAQMRQAGNKPTIGQVKMMALQAKEKIAGYEMGNAALKEHLSKKDIKRNEKFIADAVSSEGTLADLEKYNNMFIKVGKNGELAFIDVPNTPVPVKYDNATDYEESIRNGTRIVGNQEIFTKDHKIKNEAVERNAVELARNPIWRNQVLYDNQEQLAGLPPEQIAEFVTNKAFETADALKPSGFYKEEMRERYRPPQPSASDKKVSNPLQYNTTATMMRPVYENGKQKKTADGVVKEQFQMTIPISQAVQTKAPIAIQANPKMIDADTNEPIDGAFAFDFRPTNLQVIPVRDNPNDKDSKASWKPYVVGTIVKNVNGQEQAASLYDASGGSAGAKTEKTFNILVPYDGAIKSAIEAGNSVDEFEKELSKLGGSRGIDIPTITSQSQYDALPKGSKYIDSTGKTKVKK